MTDDVLELIKYRFSQAEETLTAAKELLANGHYKDAINRSYYAMFYCGLGLLAGKKLGSSKHSGVLSLFSQHFVKTGMFSAESGRHLREAFELRQRCDYREFVEIERGPVEEVIANADRFIKEAHRLLDEMQNQK
jgi:uncharacterized protein (UPF0332 family)